MATAEAVMYTAEVVRLGPILVTGRGIRRLEFNGTPTVLEARFAAEQTSRRLPRTNTSVGQGRESTA
ncbi:MAG: hypothetical protein ACXV97_07695, partial [Chthoniobacterales bacterium]